MLLHYAALNGLCNTASSVALLMSVSPTETAVKAAPLVRQWLGFKQKNINAEWQAALLPLSPVAFKL
jgi:hypothetical protein